MRRNCGHEAIPDAPYRFDDVLLRAGVTHELPQALDVLGQRALRHVCARPDGGEQDILGDELMAMLNQKKKHVKRFVRKRGTEAAIHPQLPRLGVELTAAKAIAHPFSPPVCRNPCGVSRKYHRNVMVVSWTSWLDAV
ncbi:MAG: hypothetical protein V3U27_16405 [Candidatus Tectomicrobia bacterium]